MKLHTKMLPVAYFIFLSCNHLPNNNHYNPDTPSKHNTVYSYPIEDVSLVDLIANPEKHKGRKVRVIGFLNLEFEGNCIYLHKEDYYQSISKNGLWVEIDRDRINRPSIKQCIKRYVLIEGTFDDSKGHMGLNSGSIKNIRRLEVWYPVKTPFPPNPKHDTVNFRTTLNSRRPIR